MTRIQSMTALASANVRRAARTELKHQVHDVTSLSDSCHELAVILQAGVPECMAGMPMDEVLRWLWHGGVTKTRFGWFIQETLDRVGCTEWRLLGELTVRQRSVLVNELRFRADTTARHRAAA